MVSIQGFGAQQEWTYYLEKGKLDFRLEMYDYAVFNLDKVLELNPSSYEAANIIGDILILKRNRQKAIDYFKKSLAANDAQPDIHCKIGELYEYFTNNTLAFDHLKKGVSIDPRHVMSNLNLVRFYLRRGEKELAEKHFKASYENSINAGEEPFFAARLEDSSGNFVMAIKFYQRAIELCPAMINAYMALHGIYRKEKKYDHAADILKKLIFYKPDYEKAYIYLGNMYFDSPVTKNRKRNIDLSIDYLSKALALNPENYETLYTLSEIYRIIGKRDKSLDFERMAQDFENRAQKK